MPVLDRRIPPDFEHVTKFRFSVAAPFTVAVVEKVLRLPSWHWTHDQGEEGACVGHGVAMERAITNIIQNRVLSMLGASRRYDPLQVWNAAKVLDEWADTNPGDNNGTSLRAGYQVAHEQGLSRVKSMKLTAMNRPYAVGPRAVDPAEGVAAYRWAVTVDEIRTAISLGLPVAIGVNWYQGFDSAQLVARPGKEWWLRAPKEDLGAVRGGHCVCLYGASDRRQAFKVKNSWGREYPLAWMPYATMGRLLAELGEAALVTDR